MIGLFDSGLGGLTVWREVNRVLPRHDLYYLGDTARTPYGNRPPETVYQFTKEAVDFLFKQGCELIILACNTASAEALRKLQQEYLPRHYPERRILGVIRPLAEEAAMITKNNRVGVIGTRGTINSGVYDQELKAQKPSIEVFSQAAPLLVPLIEEGWHRQSAMIKVLRSYLKPLKQARIDTLILGCTHYPWLAAEIESIVGKKVTVLSGGKIVAAKLLDYLNRHPELDQRLTKNGRRVVVTTDRPNQFMNLAKRYLGQLPAVEQVTLD